MADNFQHPQDIVERAIRNRQSTFGWVGERFYQAFPGGRLIDYTHEVPKKAEAQI